MNSVVLIGRLVKNPEIKFVPASGTAVANFTLAIDKGLTREKKQEFESQGKPTADFIRIVVWGKQAESCSNYLSKGKLVAIQGSIQSSSYKTQSGDTRYVTDVIANKVEFLEWGERTTNQRNDESSFGGDFEEFETLEENDDIPF
ncbi:MAG: single-stranded DNA-binding protein [Bacillota bacterium]|nr:single-stranded DNA-binding protein [Bacillota bacterium]